MRGQAAVEYLTTYGWAIFALLIVIAVLFSSGILSPNYLISEECTFGTNLQCNFALFNQGASTKILLNVFNGFPYKIKIISVNIETQDGKQYFSGFPTDIELDSGGNATFDAILSGPPLGEGSVKRFVGNVTYVSCAPELGPDCTTSQHVITGRVVGRVIPQ
ncbi:hypothetical protein KKB44_04875 [Candidatus Micrarchaeota archaeon]|nr:hypothetical protein [Candidatus Micrarchaeota archaeon]